MLYCSLTTYGPCQSSNVLTNVRLSWVDVGGAELQNTSSLQTSGDHRCNITLTEKLRAPDPTPTQRRCQLTAGGKVQTYVSHTVSVPVKPTRTPVVTRGPAPPRPATPPKTPPPQPAPTPPKTPPTTTTTPPKTPPPPQPATPQPPATPPKTPPPQPAPPPKTPPPRPVPPPKTPPPQPVPPPKTPPPQPAPPKTPPQPASPPPASPQPSNPPKTASTPPTPGSPSDIILLAVLITTGLLAVVAVCVAALLVKRARARGTRDGGRTPTGTGAGDVLYSTVNKSAAPAKSAGHKMSGNVTYAEVAHRSKAHALPPNAADSVTYATVNITH
ncbi:uncharacterized protein LOC134097470 [Sardina pilchardus]|uniref:uncharacterized protein LOC134097470 n=1 Tax=Sardina pilchardus TaxID=27697 RepID=UPI002E116C5C